jgi:beta-glucosidase-like glycosyl hydrolase
LDSVHAGAGAVMASYNRVNSRYACEIEALNATLKKQWGFKGLIMSDWGASFSTVAGMNNGLDPLFDRVTIHWNRSISQDESS